MKVQSFALVIVALLNATGCSDSGAESESDIDSLSAGLLGADTLPEPIGHWRFDVCAGNVVANEEGPWGAANLLNGTTCAPDAFGNAGVFDGIDDRVEIPYDSRLDFTNGMTVSSWVTPTNTTPPQTIVGKWYGPDSYLLWLSNGYYRFSVALANGGRFMVTAPATAGVLSEVVASFDSVQLRLSVNGSETSISIDEGSKKVPLQSSTRPVTIGNHPSWNPFGGRIDEVKLYNIATQRVRRGPGNCAACNPPASCCDP